MMFDSLTDPAYERTNPRDAAAAVAQLGAASSTFRDFFLKYAGPFSSEHTGFSLLDIIDQDANIITQTNDARIAIGLPERYLVLSDLLGNAVLVYDRETDAVFEMDFEGGDRDLLEGRLQPAWRSFADFLQSYFAPR